MINIPYQILALFGKPKGDNGKDEAIFYCPECVNRSSKRTPDTKGKLYVNVKKFKYHCFRCHFSGTISRDGKLYEDRNYSEDKDQDLDEITESIISLENNNEFDLKIPINKIFSNSEAVNYMLSRGFTKEQLEYYDLRVGNIDYEFGRVIIPNKVINEVYTDYYSARSFIGQEPKYHNPYKVKSNILFNLHRIEEGTPIILVEGALTAIAAGKHAVASLGKTLSKEQASMIAKKKPSMIFVNYDYGAEEYSHEACRLLRYVLPYTKIFEVLMNDERDAADLSREEYISCLEKAKEYNPIVDNIYSIIGLN